jgi:hypothetical protein
MATKVWVWQGRSPRRELWDRVRTLANQFGEPVIKMLEIPGAFVPGAPAALTKLNALLGADLNISALDSGEVMSPLDGAAGPFESADGAEPVFSDGVTLSLTVAHNGKSNQPILLERADLYLLAFEPGRIDAFEAQPEGADLHGAGLIDPMRFFVELSGSEVKRARRTVRGADGKSAVLKAESANILDTDPGSFLSIGPSDPPAMFRITVTASSPGLYRFCLRWFYRVAARELRQHTSLPIAIYRSAG